MGRSDNALPGISEPWVGILIRVIMAALTAWIGG